MAVSLNTALGAFPITALAGTGYVPLAGGTMTGRILLDSTESTGGIAGADSPSGAALIIRGGTIEFFNSGGSRTGLFASTGFRNNSVGEYGWSSSTDGAVASDLKIVRDAAATLAQRNGTTQQIFRLYNTYTDANNYERLTLTGVAGTSVNITAETLGTGGDDLDIVLTPAGDGRSRFITGAWIGNFPTYATSINIDDYGVSVIASGHYKWTSDIGTAVADTGLSRNAAGVVEVNNGTAGTYRDLKLRNLLNTEYHQMTEMTAPSAPAANSVRIYAEDNGAGKTRLMALFASGVAQQIAIEP